MEDIAITEFGHESEELFTDSNPILPTQESNFSTEISPSFKTRFGQKIPDPSLTASFGSDDKKGGLEISLESVSPSNVDIGPFFGLPSKVQELIYYNRKIKGLYDWQERCIRVGLSGQNLLISLPTSSGKTLVAEILMLRQLILHHKDALFVLPYISLVQEKVRGLCSLAVDLNFVVDEYAASKGFYPPKERRKRNTIYVATIEKANSLLESLLETNRVSELGIVVVDEVHMVAEKGGRGARLENIVTKLKHFVEDVQLVSMSATVGNLKELALFLNATLFEGGFRPVPLTQYLKVENQIAIINPVAMCEEELLEITSVPNASHKSPSLTKTDPDMLTPLVEAIIPSHSCLVFCSTRNNSQAVAAMMSACLPRSLLQWKREAKVALLAALKEEGAGFLCPVLRKTVPFGVGYHHAGLTDGEKKLLEEGFIMGSLCCIVCTSTMAAGINLPARRVIIRTPYVGLSFLSRAQYHQMTGRAGRAGLDSVGESFLLCSPRDVPKVKDLLLSSTEKCISRLAENESKGLSDLLFSMVGLQKVHCVEEAMRLAGDTLLAVQAADTGIDLRQEVLAALEKLRCQGLLRSRKDAKEDVNDTAYTNGSAPKSQPPADKPIEGMTSLSIEDQLLVCRVGKAAIKGSIELRWANRLYFDLIASRGSLAVHSHLHLLYLVTPYDSSDTFVCKPDTFFRVYSRLSPEELEIASMLGVTNARAVKISMGMKPKQLDQLVLQRFYVALLLSKLAGGDNIWDVADLFQVHRGIIQQLLSSCISFAHSVLYFCQELQELWAFRDLLSTFTKTLSMSSCKQVAPLMELTAVKFGRAKLLYKAGYKTLIDVAKASPRQLVAGVEHLSNHVARQIISSAKMLLLEKATSLQEEAEDMLLQLTSP